MTFLRQRGSPRLARKFGLLACALERMRCAARLPATIVVCYRVVQIALSWVGVGLGSNKTTRVLYCHDSDAGTLHYSIMQVGPSLLMRYFTPNM